MTHAIHPTAIQSADTQSAGMPPNAAIVIINAASGAGYDAAWANELTEKFRARGVAAQVTLAQGGPAILRAVHQAKAAGAPLVVAGGGDGTLNSVAAVLADTGTRFGVLPLGTLNHFAKDLQIPLALDDAIATIAAGHCIEVDAGEVNGKLFLNNSSLGLYPDIVADRERQQRRLGSGKWPAFVRACLTALQRFRLLQVRVCVNGENAMRTTSFVFIGNNAYVMEGLGIGARQRLDAGELSLYLTRHSGRLGLLRLALRALVGRLRQADDFEMLTAPALTIETRRARVRVATDGEVAMMAAPLHYRIRKSALRVIVPAPAANQQAT